MTPKTTRRTAIGLGSGLLVAACNPLRLPQRTAPQLFALTPKTTFEPDLPDLDATITVEPPTAVGGLNTARIALQPQPTQLDYFADALWIDVVPSMVQALLAESLEVTGRIDVLGPEAGNMRPDYVLRVHVRDFQAEYDQGIQLPPMVNVRFQSRLLALPRRQSIATTTTQQFIRSDATALPRIILAFDEALDRVLRRVVEWTITTIATT